MRILVTLGTSAFPSLIEYFENNQNDFADHDVVIQSRTITTLSANYKHVEYVYSNFIDYVKGFDLVITHAGAGNIYTFLENEIKFICVPNTDFKDKHQKEIAAYLKQENYSAVANYPEEIFEFIQCWNDLVFAPYFKKEFSCEELMQFVEDENFE